MRNPTLSQKEREEIMFREINKLLPTTTAKLIKSQIINLKKKKRGRRWSDEEKTLALSLYHSSRHCYKLLSKIFILPSISLLKLSMSKIDITPGFNLEIIQALFSKIQSMASGGNLCTLVFDEISLREGVNYDVKKDEVEGLEDFGMFGKGQNVANYAMVFMLKGLKFAWKQPIGYFLSSGTLSSFLLNKILIYCLDLLYKIGFNVKAIISDQGPNNQKLLKSYLHISENKPFFMIDDRKYYVFCDPPHLIKNVRNNLKKMDLVPQMGLCLGNIFWIFII